ncbi:carboxypeptidase regulatory-like domain-containing protein [Actinoplanes sp. NPDC026619]|uniref:carboxypeptidase regulatory-like domain-containing protein n=1 Tax=Actinoplanes sp. NPDC026619 TaxID=3155798 RepID=UPI0034096535
MGALSAPASAAAGGTVQGDFTTAGNAAIAGAYVTAYNGDGDYLADTNTTSAGHYKFTGLPAGGIKLQFDDNGRQQWSPGVFDSDAATVYQLAAGGTLTVNERQPATGRLTGHFIDAAGNPALANVTARGVTSGAYLYAYTDETGAWTIDAFPGAYTVSFNWESAKQWAVSKAAEDAATVYDVTAGQTVTVDDHKLPTGSVSGHLSKADGSPLTNAYVTLHLGDEQVGWASTFDDGNYNFGEVLAGAGYLVSFNVDNGADQWVSGTLDRDEARRITVGEGEAVTVDDTQLAPAVVHGTLVDGSGAPQAGYEVSVVLDDPDNWVNYPATTGDDGTWSVSGVLPGKYKVSFTAPDYSREQWVPGKATQAEGTAFTVAAGADVTVDETWLAGATLVVNAIDATTGAPIADTCVFVYTPRDGSGCDAGTSVTVRNLPSGTFPFDVTPGESSYYLRSGQTSVTLTAGQTTTVSVPLALGGKISTSAADRVTGAAVERTCSIFRTLGTGGLGEGYGDCTDAAGQALSQPMAAGTYELFAVAPTGYGHQWVGKKGGTGDQKAAARIVVQPGRTVAAPAVKLDKPGTITGVVSDAAGAPLAGFDVAYSAWSDSGPTWDAVTDAKGTYQIDKLGPYAWPLLFGKYGYTREWSGHTGNRFQAETVTVVTGGSTTYNFTPRKTSTIKGSVTIPAAPTASWRIHTYNAATGDDLGSFDSYGTDGKSYEVPVAGGQQVKVGWRYYLDDHDTQGFYDHAADIASATKVGIPANGTKKLNLTFG